MNSITSCEGQGDILSKCSKTYFLHDYWRHSR